jgi:hypothetical protein
MMQKQPFTQLSNPCATDKAILEQNKNNAKGGKSPSKEPACAKIAVFHGFSCFDFSAATSQIFFVLSARCFSNATP